MVFCALVQTFWISLVDPTSAMYASAIYVSYIHGREQLNLTHRAGHYSGRSAIKVLTLPEKVYLYRCIKKKFTVGKFSLNNNNNNNNFIYTVNYPISNTAGINGRTVFMNILTGIYSHICY